MSNSIEARARVSAEVVLVDQGPDHRGHAPDGSGRRGDVYEVAPRRIVGWMAGVHRRVRVVDLDHLSGPLQARRGRGLVACRAPQLSPRPGRVLSRKPSLAAAGAASAKLGASGGPLRMRLALFQPDIPQNVYPIPMRHGMTIGEIARLFNEHFGIGADLEVVAMDGLARDMYFDDTGLTWIISSPNIPTFDTTTVYPGGVLFEGTNVSEGRGTTRPFELLGAPWVDAERFADAMNRRELPGVFFRPALFEPTFHKHAGKAAPAARCTCSTAAAFRPVDSRRRADRSFSRGASRPVPLEGPAVRVRVRQDADRLPGGFVELREQIDAGLGAREIAQSWEPAVAAFEKIRQRFLLY